MKIEFYFDFSCPFACIASTRIEALCAAEGAELCWRPMLLGGLFRGADAQSSSTYQMGPAKARHTALDFQRWAAAVGLPLRKPGAHPMRTGPRSSKPSSTARPRPWPRACSAHPRVC
jgi:2-hydroxychromene-2-carboxylate isomerase